MDNRTEKQLAQEVYNAQDACNLNILAGAHRALCRLRKIAAEEGKSWNWVDTHPIMVLWADKIRSLTGTYNSDVVFDAYARLRKMGVPEEEENA